jgi:phenylacetate-CoA ligase
MRDLRNRIAYLVKDTIGLTINVTLMAPGTIPRSEGGKLRRAVDMRHL